MEKRKPKVATVLVRPSPGLKIRNPDRDFQHLSEAGEQVPRSLYWLHRIRDGDVIEIIHPAVLAETPRKFELTIAAIDEVIDTPSHATDGRRSRRQAPSLAIGREEARRRTWNAVERAKALPSSGQSASGLSSKNLEKIEAFAARMEDFRTDVLDMRSRSPSDWASSLGDLARSLDAPIIEFLGFIDWARDLNGPRRKMNKSAGGQKQNRKPSPLEKFIHKDLGGLFEKLYNTAPTAPTRANDDTPYGSFVDFVCSVFRLAGREIPPTTVKSALYGRAKSEQREASRVGQPLPPVRGEKAVR